MIAETILTIINGIVLLGMVITTILFDKITKPFRETMKLMKGVNNGNQCKRS